MIYAFAQMLSLVSGHVLMRHAFEGYHPFHAMIFMYLAALAIIAAYLSVAPSALQKLKACQAHWKPILVFLLLGAFNAATFYACLYFLGLSGQAVLSRITPVMMILSGVLLFAEKLDRAQIILIILTIGASVLFALDEAKANYHALGIVMALCASISWVAMNIVMKKFSNQINGPGLIIIRIPFMLLCFGLVFLIATYYRWVPPLPMSGSAYDMIPFVLAGLCLPILPYLLFPIALRHTDMSVMAIINSIGPVISFIVGITFFGEYLSVLKLSAAVIVITTGIAYSGHTYFKNRKPVIPPR